MGQIKKVPTVVNLISHANKNLLSGMSPPEIQFRLISKPDQWLIHSYQMLNESFAKDVIDPYERYVEWLELNRQGRHQFPFLMMAAFVELGDQAVIVGVISGNIMEVGNVTGSAPSKTEPLFIYAIGHQVTSIAVRSKGVGASLMQQAIQEAGNRIRPLGGIFGFSVLEAERPAVGFFSRQGYRWPQGVQYWQPPLEFDTEGNYVNPEVPEIMMIKPEFDYASNSIDRGLLQNIIATLYINWSLSKYRTSLSENAFKRAEHYVMGELFKRVCDTMPLENPIRLVQL